MAKTPVIEADLFTAGLLADAYANLKATHNPVTTFNRCGVEFQVVLKRIDGSRVLSRNERLLMQRVQSGQKDLTPTETRLAKRILKNLP